MASAAVIILLCMAVISGVFGIAFNLGLIIITLVKPELRSDYCWFLIGMSAMNLVYCMNLTFVQPYAIFSGIDGKSAVCQFAGCLLVTCAAGSVFTQPLLALNRYSAMFHREGHVTRYNRRNVFVMKIVVYSLSVVIAVVYVFFGDYGKFNNLCCFDMVEMPVWHLLVFFLLPVGGAYGVCLFCGLKIMKFLKTHEERSKKSNVKSNITETKQIVTLIFIEITVPICLETPILTMAIVMRYASVPDVLVSVACGLFIVHAATDPLVIAAVMKPYRTEIKKIFDRLFGRNNNVQKINNVTVMSKIDKQGGSDITE